MPDKIIHIEEIGNIRFVKNRRAKNLRITVSPSAGIRVTVPGHVTMDYAYRFVDQKRSWIKKSMVKIESTGLKNQIFKPGVNYSTRHHEMVYLCAGDENMKVKVGKGLIRVIFSSEQVLDSEESQALIRKGIEHALRVEARAILPERVHTLARKFGFTFREVKVKSMKTRWGSCSYTNNINLNIHLMRLPDDLIDYVILHELVHTVHKNHGINFWETLEKVTGNARGLAREMKKFRTTVY